MSDLDYNTPLSRSGGSHQKEEFAPNPYLLTQHLGPSATNTVTVATTVEVTPQSAQSPTQSPETITVHSSLIASLRRDADHRDVGNYQSYDSDAEYSYGQDIYSLDDELELNDLDLNLNSLDEGDLEGELEDSELMRTSLTEVTVPSDSANSDSMLPADKFEGVHEAENLVDDQDTTQSHDSHVVDSDGRLPFTQSLSNLTGSLLSKFETITAGGKSLLKNGHSDDGSNLNLNDSNINPTQNLKSQISANNLDTRSHSSYATTGESAFRPSASMAQAGCEETKSLYAYDPDEFQWGHPLAEEAYLSLRSIRDPEKPNTLEELGVISPESITVYCEPDLSAAAVAGCNNTNSSRTVPPQIPVLVHVSFKPTTPVCNLATLIGLCVAEKLKRELPRDADGFPKVQVEVAEGYHNSASSITKQLQDKERREAALENPDIKSAVEMACDMEGSY